MANDPAIDPIVMLDWYVDLLIFVKGLLMVDL